MSDEELLREAMNAPDDEAAIRHIVRIFPKLSPEKQEDLVEDAFRDGAKNLRPIRDQLKNLPAAAQDYIKSRYPASHWDSFTRRIEDDQKRADYDPKATPPSPKGHWGHLREMFLKKK